MGAGIAVEFARRWPAMAAAYRQACRFGQLQPGGLFVYQAADRLIVNLATQRGVGRGAARLEWVRQAARATAQLLVAGLALPRIGVERTDVRAVLDEELTALPYVELWSLPRDPGSYDYASWVRQRCARAGGDHLATQPPSTGSATPVRNDAAAELSQTTAAAISSGRPRRPIGSAASNSCLVSGRWATVRWIIGVSIAPGQTALTRIPQLAYSSAAALVRPTTPCLAAT